MTATITPRGTQGEQFATQYLKRHGYYIWKINWRKRDGELDIIAYCDSALVFFEVKTRSGSSIENFPVLEAVDEEKQRKIILTANRFMRDQWRELKRRRLWRFRFDIIGIYLPKQWWKDIVVLHWKEAFCDEGQRKRKVLRAS